MNEENNGMKKRSQRETLMEYKKKTSPKKKNNRQCNRIIVSGMFLLSLVSKTFPIRPFLYMISNVCPDRVFGYISHKPYIDSV